MTQMLPFSCDPGYAELGVQLGVPIMTKQSELFGYNSVPGIDLPGTSTSIFPPLAAELAGLLGAELHRPVRRADHRAPERHGGGGHRQQGRAHDTRTSCPPSTTPRARWCRPTRPKAESTVATAADGQQVTSLMEGVVSRAARRRGVGLPVLPVRRRQDGNGADGQGHRARPTPG